MCSNVVWRSSESLGIVWDSVDLPVSGCGGSPD